MIFLVPGTLGAVRELTSVQIQDFLSHNALHIIPKPDADTFRFH
jgi:hypothetical protein